MHLWRACAHLGYNLPPSRCRGIRRKAPNCIAPAATARKISVRYSPLWIQAKACTKLSAGWDSIRSSSGGMT